MTQNTQSNDVAGVIVGVLAKAEIGRLAHKGVSRFGNKKGGKFDLELLRAYEFNREGNLMQKERDIDRKNNSYREFVYNTDTAKIVCDKEEKLSDHTGHGSARFKKQAALILVPL